MHKELNRCVDNFVKWIESIISSRVDTMNNCKQTILARTRKNWIVNTKILVVLLENHRNIWVNFYKFHINTILLRLLQSYLWSNAKYCPKGQSTSICHSKCTPGNWMFLLSIHKTIHLFQAIQQCRCYQYQQKHWKFITCIIDEKMTIKPPPMYPVRPLSAPTFSRCCHVTPGGSSKSNPS